MKPVSPSFWVKSLHCMGHGNWMKLLGMYTEQVHLVNPPKEAQKQIRAIYNAVKRSPWGKKKIEVMYRKQCGLCAYCVQPLNGVYHVDHIMPIAEGGHPFAHFNLALAHPQCNLKKHSRVSKQYWWDYVEMKRRLKKGYEPLTAKSTIYVSTSTPAPEYRHT